MTSRRGAPRRLVSSPACAAVVAAPERRRDLVGHVDGLRAFVFAEVARRDPGLHSGDTLARARHRLTEALATMPVATVLTLRDVQRPRRSRFLELLAQPAVVPADLLP